MNKRTNRIFSWSDVPTSARMIIISTSIIFIFLTPILGEGYESSWSTADSGVESDLLTATADSDGIIWVFGEGGIILNSSDMQTWVSSESPTTSNLWTSDSLDDIIVAAGERGTVILKPAESNTWTSYTTPAAADLLGVAITGEGVVVAVGENGAVWILENGIWLDRTFGLSIDFNDVDFEGERGLIAANEGRIFGSEDGGLNWEERDTPDGLTDSTIISIDYYLANRGYAITSEGQILKSTQEGLTTAVGYNWLLVEIESEDRNTTLQRQISSMEVLGTTKFIVAGPSGYVALSKDGGNIINPQLLPVPNDFSINDIAMRDAFQGVIIGEEGTILWTENAGEDLAVGFEIIDLSQFNEFVDFSKDNLWQGLKATVKIVGFGILLGFFIGVTLAMCKTAPTTLKQIIEGNLGRALYFFWVFIPVYSIGGKVLGNLSSGLFFALIITLISWLVSRKYDNRVIAEAFAENRQSSGYQIPEKYRINLIRTLGVSILVGLPFSEFAMRGGIVKFWQSISDFRSLDLTGIEYIFAPVGDPDAFFNFLLGIALIYLGILFITFKGQFKKHEFSYGFKLNPWGIRPLASIATLYTDFFRNTPLIVQFMFVHFGLQIGKHIQGAGTDLFTELYLLSGGADLFIEYGLYAADAPTIISKTHEFIFSDRAFLSAIFALGLNSGAYQCETIRGAIAAIPSGQMEAGRSIGLTYMGTMNQVVLPQAIRICIPPLGNEMVNLVLNSSLAMVIAYTELTRQGKLIIAITFQIFWTWGMVMVSYFVVTWTLALILRWLEDKTRIPGLGISGGA